MKAIETSAVVTDDKKVTISVPADIASGEHKVVLIIDENPLAAEKKDDNGELNFKILKWENWPSDCSFQRNEIYGF